MKKGTAVLVTGASGFLGKRLTSVLAAQGFRVHAVVRRRPMPGLLGVRYHVGSILDRRFAAAAIGSARPRIVFHLAGVTKRRDENLVRVNAVGTGVWAAAIVASGLAPRVVFASTCEVYGDGPTPFQETQPAHPLSAYAHSKRAAERILEAAAGGRGFSVAILRFSLIYGPGHKPGMFLADIVRAARAGKRFPMTEGRQRRDFLHLDDAVAALLAAAKVSQRGARVFNVAAGHSVTLADLARLVERLAGRRFVGKGSIPYRSDEIFNYVVSTARARRELGWRCQVALEAGLSPLIVRRGGRRTARKAGSVPRSSPARRALR